MLRRKLAKWGREMHGNDTMVWEKWEIEAELPVLL